MIICRSRGAHMQNCYHTFAFILLPGTTSKPRFQACNQRLCSHHREETHTSHCFFWLITETCQIRDVSHHGLAHNLIFVVFCVSTWIQSMALKCLQQSLWMFKWWQNATTSKLFWICLAKSLILTFFFFPRLLVMQGRGCTGSKHSQPDGFLWNSTLGVFYLLKKTCNQEKRNKTKSKTRTENPTHLSFKMLFHFMLLHSSKIQKELLNISESHGK